MKPMTGLSDYTLAAHRDRRTRRERHERALRRSPRDAVLGRILRTGTFAVGILFIAATPGRTAPPAGAPTVSAAESLRVDQVVEEALRHNDRVAASRLMEEAAKRRIAPAGAWDDPMLMAGVANLPTSFDFKEDMMTMTMVGVSQSIPYAGEKGLQAKAAESEASAASETRRFTETDVAVAAKIAYYDLYYRTVILTDLERQREILEQIVESSTAKLRTNQAGQDEVLSSQAELWRLESLILTAQQKVAASQYTLNSLRGTDPASPLGPLAGPRLHEVPASPDPWLETAERQYPPLQEIEYRSQSYGFSAAAARRMRWPMLSLSGSYGFRQDSKVAKRDDMVSVFASFSLPLSKGRRQKETALSMEAMQRGASAEVAQMRRDIKSEILTLHERAKRLDESLGLYRNRIIPTMEDAYQSALSGYINNRTSFTALLSYAQAIIRDRIAASETANELAMTLSEVERYTWIPAETGEDRGVRTTRPQG